MSYYTIGIPTKPYLKKYFQTLYGKPIVFDRDNYFGTSLTGYLERKFFTRQSADLKYRHFDNFCDVLIVHMPGWWLKQSHFATDIPVGNVIAINKHFEERFEEDLVKFVRVMQLAGIQIKSALEKFLEAHDIEVDEDITYDAIKKKHQRKREKFNKLYCKSVPSKLKVVKPSFEAFDILPMTESLSFTG